MQHAVARQPERGGLGQHAVDRQALHGPPLVAGGEGERWRERDGILGAPRRPNGFDRDREAPLLGGELGADRALLALLQERDVV